MGGHIIVPLSGVTEERIAVRREAGKEALQIATDFRVGVLYDQERSGGVEQLQSRQAGFKPGSLDLGDEVIRDLKEATTVCGDGPLVQALGDQAPYFSEDACLRSSIFSKSAFWG